MALQLNLLHEEFTEERQRKRDPLKLGVMGLIGIGVIFFLYYAWNAYETIQIKSQLNTAEAEWQRVEPNVTAAQKRATELHQIIDSTKVLDGSIEERFYWAPFLATVSHCVAPNIQVTSLDGSLVEADHSITVSLEGLAAAREPRAAAEEFRPGCHRWGPEVYEIHQSCRSTRLLTSCSWTTVRRTSWRWKLSWRRPTITWSAPAPGGRR